MPSYESGTELIDAIIRQGNKFISEFGDIPDQYWDTLQPDVDDRTPRQMLAYQLGWMNLLLEWEHAEEQGHVAAMPAEGYAWNRLGELYEHFYTTWQDVAPQQMIDTFHEQVNHICWMVTSFSQQESSRRDNVNGRPRPSHHGRYGNGSTSIQWLRSRPSARRFGIGSARWSNGMT